jgi:hypothetical protein
VNKRHLATGSEPVTVPYPMILPFCPGRDQGGGIDHLLDGRDGSGPDEDPGASVKAAACPRLDPE